MTQLLRFVASDGIKCLTSMEVQICLRSFELSVITLKEKKVLSSRLELSLQVPRKTEEQYFEVHSNLNQVFEFFTSLWEVRMCSKYMDSFFILEFEQYL